MTSVACSINDVELRHYVGLFAATLKYVDDVTMTSHPPTQVDLFCTRLACYYSLCSLLSAAALLHFIRIVDFIVFIT